MNSEAKVTDFSLWVETMSSLWKSTPFASLYLRVKFSKKVYEKFYTDTERRNDFDSCDIVAFLLWLRHIL